MAKAANVTTDQILAITQDLMQVHGWHGVSFRDIADRLDIKSSSLHHHYRTKALLGLAMVRAYSAAREAAREAALDELAASRKSPPEQVKAFGTVFQALLSDEGACLGGIAGPGTA